jgi:LEA14-like dessication related protein
MKIEKKHIVVTTIALASFTGAALYWQYQKLTSSCITFKKIILKKLSLQQTNLDLFLNFKNLSNIKIHIVSQNYKVFLNDKEIVTASNSMQQTILPKETSVLALNVDFQPTKLLNTISNLATSFALTPQKVLVTIKVDIKVKLWFFSISIPYEYITTIADLLSNKQENKSTSNVKKC